MEPNQKATTEVKKSYSNHNLVICPYCGREYLEMHDVGKQGEEIEGWCVDGCAREFIIVWDFEGTLPD